VPDLLERADPRGWTDRIARARAELVAVLAARGWTAVAADAPWVLVPRAADLRDALATQAVVVRDCASFGLADHVRIAVPDADGLTMLDRALATVSVGRPR